MINRIKRVCGDSLPCRYYYCSLQHHGSSIVSFNN
jgi:hypothetical protein